ncbi:MAG TPA: hypothetical protein P5205_12300 [Candidatus Paceibacterota bacterium]|nr:hypothetical protein [Verrucomicrobiota bacterium]HSA11141.1 hypothetical protein [Candidatus Paceibacterota bacterium]
MTSRALLIISVAANVVLAGVLLSRKQPGSERAEAAGGRGAAPAAEVVSASRALPVLPTNAAPAAFDWRQVESPDYRQYVANLRAIGCPGETIKDIVIADAMKFYAQRSRAVQTRRPFKYWEADEKDRLPKEQREQFNRAKQDYEKDLPRLLHELLGINLAREMAQYLPAGGLFGTGAGEEELRKLGMFSEEKQQRLSAWRDEYEWRRDAVDDAELNPADRAAQLRQLEREQQAVLAGILTPAEIEEYEMAFSQTGDTLRSRLVGFDPSAEEFRRLFQFQKTFDDKYANADTADPQVAREKEADQARLEDAIRQQLGDARFAEYQRSGDQTYQELCFFGAEHELSPAIAISAFGIKQAAERARQELLATSGLSAEQRGERLKAIAAETRAALREAMGSDTFTRYDQIYGGWIQVLGRRPKE